MTDLFATITEADKGLAYPRMSLLCTHSPGYGCEMCRRLNEPAPAPIARARAFAACNLTVLALDLGTTTGWAVATREGRQKSGSFRLDPAKLGGNGRRWIAFREWLTATAREAGGVQAVYFEQVRNHTGTTAAHVYGGYMAMLEAWCAANNIPMHGVAVATAKKHWTGNGRAKKPEMIAEAERRGIKVIDDNHADALAILAYGVKQEA